MLPDYQGVGVGKRLLNFVAELYTSQLPEIPFYLVTSNPQLVRSNLECWRVKRVGHGSRGGTDSRINQGISKSNSRRRLSVSLQYIPKSLKTTEVILWADFWLRVQFFRNKICAGDANK